MARQIEGINGGFCGRVGTVIGYQWRGKWCMRAYPRHINDARSELQLAQREIFVRMVRYAAAWKEVLRVGFRERSLRMHLTELNYFVNLNKDCFSMEQGRLTVDYGHLVVSDGTVEPVGFGEVELVRDERRLTVRVGFEEYPLGSGGDGSDKVYLAAVCEGRPDVQLSAPAYRRNGSVTMELPACWEGRAVHLYGFVQDYTGASSTSFYLGRIEYSDDPREGNGKQIPDIKEASLEEDALMNVCSGNDYSIAAAISAARLLSSSGDIST